MVERILIIGWLEGLFEEITFKLSLIAEMDVAIQRARRKRMLQVKEKLSSKVLRLERVWLYLGTKGKHEWCETSAKATSLRVGFIGHDKEFGFHSDCNGRPLEDFK